MSAERKKRENPHARQTRNPRGAHHTFQPRSQKVEFEFEFESFRNNEK